MANAKTTHVHDIVTFTFSDGGTIEKCRVAGCTHGTASRREILCGDVSIEAHLRNTKINDERERERQDKICTRLVEQIFAVPDDEATPHVVDSVEIESSEEAETEFGCASDEDEDEPESLTYEDELEEAFA